MDNKPVSSKKEFLKKTMTDKNFIHNYGKVVSASPYRAVVRRMDYSSMVEDDGSEEEASPSKFEEDFDRDEEEKSMFQTQPHYSEQTPTGRAAVQPIISDENLFFEN
jgi:hypothetical protein